MALIQTSLIWVTYGVAIALLIIIASTFVFLYQNPRERAISVTAVSILTISSLLATILLLPVDIALVSSTTSVHLGRKRDWADEDTVNGIWNTLKIVYYTLYSLDALLCLIVVPFTYFWFEEHDQDEEGERGVGLRLWGAFKYTIGFILLVVIIFLVGIFIPFAKQVKDDGGLDLDYFKRLLAENHGERALTFGVGLLMTIGTIVYIIYTSAGLVLLPVSLIRSAPAISATSLAEDTASQLDQNRERQRQLENRNEGREEGLDSRDRRELEALIREERTLIRRERLAADAQGEGRSWFIRAWTKVEAVFRPLKLIGGWLLLIIALLIFTSMLITGIDKAKNSVCKVKCGYLLGHINIFQPINWFFVKLHKAFPIDYIVFLLLVLLFFAASVAGIATIGIRFLWITIFRIRKGRSSPQALLLATILLTLISLALNYSITMMVAPGYATFGTQTYCARPIGPEGYPKCEDHPSSVRPCSELAKDPAAKGICTPTFVSTFINRITINFPFFGVINFWAQYAFLGVFLIVFVTSLFRTPKLDTDGLDADLEEDEEEGLLSSTGRRFNATWQDITGRSKQRLAKYGATDTNGGERDHASGSRTNGV